MLGKFYKGGACVWMLALALVFSLGLVAQELYGALRIQVVDETGAVIPGAAVEISGPALMLPQSGTTDGQGNYNARTLPPGTYTVFVSSSGFKSTTIEKVRVEIGKTYPVDVTLPVGSESETIIVESNELKIDTATTESAQNLSGDLLTTSAGGRDFSSFAQYKPSVNAEALSGGISVDGSSGAENVFYVDGVDTTNMYNGLNNQSMRVDVLEEFQLKTAGYDAQFGGAMGGVMNLRTKSGTDSIHGSVLWFLGGDSLNALWHERLRYVPGTNRTAFEYIQDPADKDTISEFGFTLGAPIVRDKAWFFAALMPQKRSRTRDITWEASGNASSHDRDDDLLSTTIKLDFQPVSPLKMFTSYSSDETEQVGSLPGFDGTGNETFPYELIGFTNPGYTVTGGMTYTPNANFVLDARWGLNVVDREQAYGPDRVRHRFNYSNSAIGYPDTDPNYAEAGTWTISDASSYQTQQDFQKKNTIGFDGSYFATGGGGTHNLKFGFQFNRLNHAVNSAYKYDYVRFAWGRPYTDLLGATRTSTCTGFDGVTVYDPCGYYDVRHPFGVTANVHTNRQALYLQDSWTMNDRLTLNLGLRFESEEIPSFSDLPAFSGAAVKWGFGEKFAPRMGFAYDLFGDRKVKIHASYGWFYDAMKLEMANGSFGGFKWESWYYLMDTATANNWQGVGGLSGAGPYPGTFIETRNWRIPSFDDLDPNLKPMRMSAFVAGVEMEAATDYIFSILFTHKQVDEAIEDVGRQTPAGEAYYITNPGRGYSVSKFLEAGLPATPDPDRTYNAYEFRIRRAMKDNWRADLSYAFTSLEGLYSGLGSSDENGRLSPNVDRDFDLWFLNYDSNGNLLSGPLNTDRPHQIKGNWTYITPFDLEIGGFFRAMSGAPITRTMTFENVDIQVDGRNSDGRNPFWTQSDISLTQSIKPFDDESKEFQLSFNVLNVFNQQTTMTVSRNLALDSAPLWQAGDPTDIVLNGYDYQSCLDPLGCLWTRADVTPFVSAPNVAFGQGNRFRAPLSARFGVRFIF